MSNRLHLIKLCLCCLIVIQLYSNNLSTIATISSLIMLESFPACFSCNNNFILLHNSSGSVHRSFIFEIPDAIRAGDFNNFISDLSLSLFRPFCLMLKFIFLPTHLLVFDLAD